jgi:hypothetical protein
MLADLAKNNDELSRDKKSKPSPIQPKPDSINACAALRLALLSEML